LFGPASVALDGSGNLYIGDGNLVRKVSGGIITTVVGNGFYGSSGDGGPATSASIQGSTALAVDRAGNHSGPQERPRESRGFDQPLDFRVQGRDRIGLPALEEGVCRFVRGREEYDAPGAADDPLESGSNRGRRGGPHQEHRIDAIQACLKGLKKGEIARYDIHVRRQGSGVRIAGQRADFDTRGR